MSESSTSSLSHQPHSHRKSKLERKLELLEIRFQRPLDPASPSDRSWNSPEPNSKHSFSFDTPSLTATLSRESSSGGASPLPQGSVRSKRPRNQIVPSFDTVNQITTQYLQKMADHASVGFHNETSNMSGKTIITGHHKEINQQTPGMQDSPGVPSSVAYTEMLVVGTTQSSNVNSPVPTSAVSSSAAAALNIAVSY
jgi:hypothetical protein